MSTYDQWLAMGLASDPEEPIYCATHDVQLNEGDDCPGCIMDDFRETERQDGATDLLGRIPDDDCPF